MNKLLEQWKKEEQAAFSGWDFSHLAGRQIESPLPWDFLALAQAEVAAVRNNPSARMLDMDTGGGEFLISLDPPRGRTDATENWPTNIEVCRKLLPEYGIGLSVPSEPPHMPFPDESFDLVLNRHGDYDPRDIARILKPGGVFLTQQVGGKNNRDLSDFLLGPDIKRGNPSFGLVSEKHRLGQAGLVVTAEGEDLSESRFLDVGAVVWFAHVIEWEFPGFSVARCLDRLKELQHRLDQGGQITSTTHRFYLHMNKPREE